MRPLSRSRPKLPRTGNEQSLSENTPPSALLAHRSKGSLRGTLVSMLAFRFTPPAPRMASRVRRSVRLSSCTPAPSASVLREVRSALAAHRDDENAAAMRRYMKMKFTFFGVKAPLRCAAVRDVFARIGERTEGWKGVFDAAREIWMGEERECQLCALDLVFAFKKRWGKGLELEETAEVLGVLETFVREKQWWDTVDFAATKGFGTVGLESPAVVGALMDRWIEDDDVWVRRTALLYQLKFKERTDEERLFGYIRKQHREDSFWIRKAIGWALREYRKTNRAAVDSFVESASLSLLSTREALKHK